MPTTTTQTQSNAAGSTDTFGPLTPPAGAGAITITPTTASNGDWLTGAAGRTVRVLVEGFNSQTGQWQPSVDTTLTTGLNAKGVMPSFTVSRSDFITQFRATAFYTDAIRNGWQVDY